MHELGQIRCAIRGEGVMANRTRRRKGLKKAARSLKGVQKVTWVMAWESDVVSVDVHVVGKKAQENRRAEV